MTHARSIIPVKTIVAVFLFFFLSFFNETITLTLLYGTVKMIRLTYPSGCSTNVDPFQFQTRGEGRDSRPSIRRCI